MKQPVRHSVHHIHAVLIGICLVAVLLRLYHVWAATAISPDGALFIEFARRMGGDLLSAVRSYEQHPLYPLLLWLAHAPMRLFVNEGPNAWIRAGQAVALIGSLAAILGMYWFGKRLYGPRRGLIAAAMLALLPDACRLGGDVLTDMPHLALYLFGLASVLTGLRFCKSRFFLLAAIFAGLAFLTRPEGGAVLPVGIAGCFVLRNVKLSKRILTALGMCLVFFCVVGPYQCATGKFVPKKPLNEMLDVSRGALPERNMFETRIVVGDRAGGDANSVRQAANLFVPVDVLYQWFRAGRVVYILLALFGLYAARPVGRKALVLGMAAGIHVLLLHVLEYRYGYLDRRHALVLATLSLPLAAVGTWRLARLIVERFGHSTNGERIRAVVGVICACVGMTSHWMFSPINQQDAFVVAGARWLAANSPEGSPVVSDSRMRRVALYADRPFVEWRWWNGQVRYLAECLKAHPNGYFVVNPKKMTCPERNPQFFEDLSKRFGDRLELVHTERFDGSEMRIYRYQE